MKKLNSLQRHETAQNYRIPHRIVCPNITSKSGTISILKASSKQIKIKSKICSYVSEFFSAELHLSASVYEFPP
jgi:hypothetical protein